MAAWTETDGGRAAAGYKGCTGDCVVRALAISAEISYQEAYDALFEQGRERKVKNPSPRNGVARKTYESVFARYGAVWTPTMRIGSGTTVHLRADELPTGRLIARLSKHLCAVIDGVVHDLYDPSREGTRAVYGYWRFPS